MKNPADNTVYFKGCTNGQEIKGRYEYYKTVYGEDSQEVLEMGREFGDLYLEHGDRYRFSFFEEVPFFPPQE